MFKSSETEIINAGSKRVEKIDKMSRTFLISLVATFAVSAGAYRIRESVDDRAGKRERNREQCSIDSTLSL